jgi:hypothetical protein
MDGALNNGHLAFHRYIKLATSILSLAMFTYSFTGNSFGGGEIRCRRIRDASPLKGAFEKQF